MRPYRDRRITHRDCVATFAAALLVLVTACGDGRTSGPPIDPETASLVGAGDIATCGSTADEATADLVSDIPGTVIAVGDNVYELGWPSEFSGCYQPSWGRFKDRTRPAVGNHEYMTTAAEGYFGYWGAAAAPPGGYYGYDLGAWRVVVLNSNLAHIDASAQERWLADDLSSHETRCTLAYFHHPRFSSGEHGNDASMRPIWAILHAAGADVVISGHDHDYERFAPQTPDGVADPAGGIRQFVVGTGGAPLRPFATVRANSEVRRSDRHGVIRLVLEATRYEWEFIATPDGQVLDSGSGDCH